MSDNSHSAPAGIANLFLRGFSWAFASSVGNLVLQVATLVILSRLLTPVDFGIVAVAVAALGVVSLVVELGVGPALIQHKALNPRHVGSALWLSLLFGAAATAGCFLAADTIARWLGMAPQADVIRLLSFSVALQPLVTILTALARRDLEIRNVALSNLLGSALGYSIVAIGLTLLGLGYWALAIAQLAQLLVTLAILAVSQGAKVSFRMGRRELADILDFGCYFSIGRLANYAAQKFDRVLVGNFLGLEAAGNYQRVLNILQVVGPFVAGPLDTILFPLLSRLQDDATRLRRSYRATTAVAAMLTLPASVVVCVTAPFLVPAILGPQWTGVVLPAQIMAGTLFFRTNDSITATIVRAVGRVKARAALQVLYAALSLASIYLLKDFGLPGVAAGLLAVTVLNFVLMSFLIRRIANMTIMDNFSPLLPGLLIAAILGFIYLAFYLALDNEVHSVVWMALYLSTAALASGLLALLLPGRMLPPEVSELRSLLRRRVSIGRRQLGPAE